MIEPHQVTAILAFAASMPITIGYARIALFDRGVAGHMAMSTFCVTGAYAWRGLYWDVGRLVLGPETWAEWYRATDGLAINNFWNVVVIYGGWRGLRAMHEMIPDRDRHAWRTWNAWLYPPWRTAAWLRQIARGFARRNRPPRP